MKKIIAFSLTTMFAVGALASSSEDLNTYFLLEAGYSRIANRDKVVQNTGNNLNNFALTTGVGYRMSANFRTDLTYNYISAVNFKNNKLTPQLRASYRSDLVLLSVYYDIPEVSEIFIPYVGAGFGFVKNHYKLKGSDGSFDSSKGKFNTGWQLTAGSLFDVSDMIDVNIAYKFTDYGKFKLKINPANKNHFRTHQVVAGARVKF